MKVFRWVDSVCCTHVRLEPYISLLAALVVGQLDLLEGHSVSHPLLTTSRGVWVSVNKGAGLVGVSFAHRDPFGVDVLETALAGGDHLRLQGVPHISLQPPHRHRQPGKHPPAERKEDPQSSTR